MRKITFLLLSLIMSVGAMAQDWSVDFSAYTMPRIHVVREALDVVPAENAADNSHWYIIKDKRYQQILYSAANNYSTFYPNTTKCSYYEGRSVTSTTYNPPIVRFLKTGVDGIYQMQFANGQYAYGSGYLKTQSTYGTGNGTYFKVAPIQKNVNSFAINMCNSFSGEDYSAGPKVEKNGSYVKMGTSGAQTSASSGWALYEVQIHDLAWDETAQTYKPTPAECNIKYTIKDNAGNVVYSQSETVANGAAYPALNYSNPLVNVVGAPVATTELSGVARGDIELVLPTSTKYNIAVDAASASAYYALSFCEADGEGTPLVDLAEYPDFSGSCALKYTTGAVPTDGYGFALVGDAFSGVKLYSKTAHQFVDVQGGWSAYVDEASAPVFTVEAGTKAGTLALKKGDEYLICEGYLTTSSEKTAKCDVKFYYVNYSPSEMTVTMPDVDATGYSQSYLTVCLPFHVANIPSDIKFYKVSEINEKNQLQIIQQTGTMFACTPYIIRGTMGQEYTFSNTTTSTENGSQTEGLLTGVMNEYYGNPYFLPSVYYVLQNHDGVLGFYKSEGATTIPANKCYLTLPSSVGEFISFANEEATGINEVVAPVEGDGKFVENGQIVIVKNGVKYNVAGQRL